MEGGDRQRVNFPKKIKKQDPESPAKLRENSTVIIWVYDEYKATPQELVETLNCTAYANSHSDWNHKTGRPECFCNTNHKWNSNGTACIPISSGGQPSQPQEDPMCPAMIYTIKLQQSEGANASYLQILARNAQSSGCSDPVIDQILGGGGTGTGTGTSTGEEDQCECVDSDGRRWRHLFGQPCDTEPNPQTSTHAIYDGC